MKTKAKIKYRIILENEFYYPQYKGWICWHFIYRGGISRYCFDDLKRAEDFIESRKNFQEKGSFAVVKEYDINEI